jgi:predicted DNA-binding transcriptional regulator YafY
VTGRRLASVCDVSDRLAGVCGGGRQHLPASRVTGDSDLGASWIDASIGVWDQRWFIRLVLSMGGDLVVVAPPALRDAVHVAAQEGISANEAG